MTGLEIGLLIIGAVFFVGSFFVSEKLSSSDMSEIEGLSEKEIQVLLDKKLKDADQRIDNALSQKIDEKNEEFTAGADKETNNRIMSIGEYADSVFDSMNKTHEEILFMYQMLNDKQEALTDLTKTLGEAESHVRELLSESERQKEIARETPVNVAGRAKAAAPAIDTYSVSTNTQSETVKKPQPIVKDTTVKEDKETIAPTEPKKPQEAIDEQAAVPEADDKAIAPDRPKEKKKEKTDTKQIRKKVISMYHQGYSILDIAKETGKGMGEIQLILELFDEKEETP